MAFERHEGRVIVTLGHRSLGALRALAGLVATVAAALVLGGLSAAAAQGANGVNAVTYTASDWSFSGPAELPAGMTRIDIANQMDRELTFIVVSLSGGRGLEDYFGAVGQIAMGDLLSFPEWVNHHGGVSVPAGETRGYTVFLGPGHYHLEAPFADAQGPYAARGLLQPLTVTAPPVDAGVKVTLQDYEFTVDGAFVAGRQTVEIENVGNQSHEMLLLALPPGLSAEELLALPPPVSAAPHLHTPPHQTEPRRTARQGARRPRLRRHAPTRRAPAARTIRQSGTTSSDRPRPRHRTQRHPRRRTDRQPRLQLTRRRPRPPRPSQPRRRHHHRRHPRPVRRRSGATAHRVG